ncbi:MAG: hypothetical protein CVU61_05625 [Deltaproteobacteria bacterium HGW-Deltaproteobacteria-19]|nr:MAG: hypothetical protein CVU61_05625 [Deltaproteobacteria bacterium HGW-Deltaproteobacteria-19]
MRNIILSSLFLVLAAVTAFAAPSSLPPYEFFAGDYDIVGSMPDEGESYTGSARISAGEDGLVLLRIVDGKETTFHGRFERTSVGESDILLFQGEAPEAMMLSCLHVSDPDNYPRLNCLWGQGKKRTASPGLEAFFPAKERIPAQKPASTPPAKPSVNQIWIADPEIR